MLRVKLATGLLGAAASAAAWANIAPTVAITGLANGASYQEGATITISASASDRDGTIQEVSFWANNRRLGSDLSGPYSWTWRAWQLVPIRSTLKPLITPGSR